MAQEDINTLNITIDELTKRWNELDELADNTPSLDQQDEIYDEMDEINIRKTRLKILRNHLKAAGVIVNPPNDDQKTQIQNALNALSVHIQKDQGWEAAVGVTENILAATKTIRTNINQRKA